MSVEPVVSVIIPVFNAGKNVENCIQSLLNQTYKNFEILIIDDGSTDNTLTILEKYERNKKIKVIHQTNSGVSTARNLGISKANGKYIGFVDADDRVRPNYLEDLVVAIETEKNIDVAICGFEIQDSLTKAVKYKTNFSQKIVSAKNVLSHIFDFDGPLGFVWNKLWKKEIIEKNKISFRNDVTMAEDLIFVIEYLLCATSVNITDKINYVYYKNDNSLSSNYTVKKQKNDFIPMYEHYKQSGYIIKNMLSKEPDLKQAAEANIVQINLGFMRNLNLNNLKQENAVLYNKLRQECIRYGSSYFSSSMTNTKKKITYTLTIYFAYLMSKIDVLVNKQ
ncbi:glycosyltransferase [Lactobacillus johnsonii]|uniref:glycosyltransferase n=1 Tax=Lactobacillus johnsonii TaxID=33959 RepID=UPI001CBA70AF|nr:glycosyltransferase [Lactobacillus johnsonii]MBZ4027788.1 glycosyltransferase [Lactobacillus johnsonii]